MKQKIWGKRDRGISAAVLWGLAVLLSGCGVSPVRQQSSVDTAMGTVVTQTLYVRQADREEGRGEQTDSVLQLLTQLERQELSWRVEGSEVARINAGACSPAQETPVFLSPSMGEILSSVWQISSDSGGALDVTLGGLSRLWNLDESAAGSGGITDENAALGSAAQPQIPTPEQIQSALGDVGYERVELSEETIVLPPGMQLDLGAVGKGIACDRISAYLHGQSRVTGAVVAVGGSVVTYGQKPDGSPWKVAIVHPREEGEYLGILSLTGEHYVSTSGDYERYVMAEGVRYHHILDPSTGYPARSGLCSVTIVCDSGLLADALSTACFVLGPEGGLALARDYGAEALLVEEDGTLHMTEGMGEIFSAGR